MAPTEGECLPGAGAAVPTRFRGRTTAPTEWRCGWHKKARATCGCPGMVVAVLAPLSLNGLRNAGA